MYRFGLVAELARQSLSVLRVRVLALFQEALSAVALHAIAGQTGYKSVKDGWLSHFKVFYKRKCLLADATLGE
jgi:hypothetical protein